MFSRFRKWLSGSKRVNRQRRRELARARRHLCPVERLEDRAMLSGVHTALVSEDHVDSPAYILEIHRAPERGNPQCYLVYKLENALITSYQIGCSSGVPLDSLAAIFPSAVAGKLEIFDYPGEYAQRLDGVDASAKDSIWIDLGFPVQQGPDGQHFKPLFALYIEDLDNRINVNVHGNVMLGGDHGSNQGWGRWEVNLAVNSVDSFFGDGYESPLWSQGRQLSTLQLAVDPNNPHHELLLTVDWGDGSAPQVAVCPSDPSTFSLTHRYTQDGQYDVKLSLTDEDGGIPSETVLTHLVRNVDIVVVGAGPGAGPHVKVFDAANNQTMHSFLAYDQNFQGGVRVAAGDVNGDGRDDIITAAADGSRPMKAFDGLSPAALDAFFAAEATNPAGLLATARR